MVAGWSGWWPGTVAFVVGLVLLGVVSAVVVRRARRTGRELAGFRADVRGGIERLRSLVPGR